MTFPTRAQLDAWHDEAMENGSKTAINRLHDAAARLLALPEVDAIEITSAMEEAGMKEVQYQYNLPSTRAGVVAVFRAMLRAHSSPLAPQFKEKP